MSAPWQQSCAMVELLRHSTTDAFAAGDELLFVAAAGAEKNLQSCFAPR